MCNHANFSNFTKQLFRFDDEKKLRRHHFRFSIHCVNNHRFFKINYSHFYDFYVKSKR